MGYDTKFKGTLNFNSTLTEKQLIKIKSFLGQDCRNHPEWETQDLTNISLRLLKDNSGLEWDGSQKTSALTEKINFIIAEIQKIFPEFGLSGKLLAQGDNIDDRYIIVIEDNKAIEIKE